MYGVNISFVKILLGFVIFMLYNKFQSPTIPGSLWEVVWWLKAVIVFSFAQAEQYSSS